MSISTPWLIDLQKAIKAGLRALYKEPPLTAVEWADNHFYLSSESSYQEGKWKTAPFQVAILNSMGNDLTRVINLIKSARVGYTKMLMANVGYKIQHKRRNVLTFCPTDPDAEELMKRHVETMVRDVPKLLELAPWNGKKHRDSSLSAKRFQNSKMLWCLGGKASRNYREKSPDEVIYDELSKFEANVEGEGAPTFLGDKRLEGATFPKSIRGSTPKIKGTCQIEKAGEESPFFLRYHIPCPGCGKEQHLKWGGKDCDFGIKRERNEHGEIDKAWYCCEHTHCVVQYHEMVEAAHQGRWICEKTGIWTRDGIDWYAPDGTLRATPRTVTFHIWTAYSTFTTWLDMVIEHDKVKDNRENLIAFVNTTLGETWEDDQGEKVDWEQLYLRREVFSQVPARGLTLMGGIDTQDDRYEGRVWAFGAGEEAWLVDKWVLMGDPASEELRRKVGLKIHQQYSKADGSKMRVERWAWDSGGHYTDEVYAESRKHGDMWVIPVKGANRPGKPIANWPKTRNAKKVFLTEVGTENAKELIYSRLKLQPDTSGVAIPGCIHFPANDDICGEDELKQLTAETKELKIEKGKRIYRWDAKGRRNEALDCFVYALAALRISQHRFGLDLEILAGTRRATPQRGTRSRVRG
ncbi:phage terminase large subunit family protein [Pseudomonas gingeri]|uniref:phage terminase large subunit family protein n=1 Tax=Pseudomonas gingeri TaxID=117681 RepID=UPI0015C0F5BD|nr:terminase gpA endonuclease subunit [Pseudomonas gingeri]NWD49030.1 phage terminase large subunit family protein [Pseudomonas gingeri]